MSSLLSEDEKKSRRLLRKARRLKKKQNIKLLAENHALREKELNLNSQSNYEFEDDLIKEEENEVNFLYSVTR